MVDHQADEEVVMVEEVEEGEVEAEMVAEVEEEVEVEEEGNKWIYWYILFDNLELEVEEEEVVEEQEDEVEWKEVPKL